MKWGQRKGRLKVRTNFPTASRAPLGEPTCKWGCESQSPKHCVLQTVPQSNVAYFHLEMCGREQRLHKEMVPRGFSLTFLSSHNVHFPHRCTNTSGQYETGNNDWGGLRDQRIKDRYLKNCLTVCLRSSKRNGTPRSKCFLTLQAPTFSWVLHLSQFQTMTTQCVLFLRVPRLWNVETQWRIDKDLQLYTYVI